MHAFNIQQFADDKDKLWKLLKLHIDIRKVQYAETSLLKKIIVMLKMMLVHPFNLTRIVFGYVRKRLIS